MKVVAMSEQWPEGYSVCRVRGGYVVVRVNDKDEKVLESLFDHIPTINDFLKREEEYISRLVNMFNEKLKDFAIGHEVVLAECDVNGKIS